MNHATISVIVPIYNSGKYINKCLDSLLNQTLNSMEIICINDGSTDNSLKIIEEYRKKSNKIRIINQSHSGQGVARNKGVSVASGQFIGFVDSDDYVALNFYEELYIASIKHNVDCVACKAMTVDENNADIQKLSIWGKLPAGIYSQDQIKQLDWFNTGCSPVLWDKLFKNEIVKKHPSTNLARGQDFVALIDYTKEIKNIELIDKHLYFYRHHNQSVMSYPESINTLSADLHTEAIATEKIISYYKGYPIVDFYITEIVKYWSNKMNNIQLRYFEKQVLLSILNENFRCLEKFYKTHFDLIKNILTTP